MPIALLSGSAIAEIARAFSVNSLHLPFRVGKLTRYQRG